MILQLRYILLDWGGWGGWAAFFYLSFSFKYLVRVCAAGKSQEFGLNRLSTGVFSRVTLKVVGDCIT
jgi:hypothetical protein